MEKIITLNNIDYLVIKEIDYNNKKYTYAISYDNSNKVVLLKEENKDGTIYIESVNDEKEYKEVLTVIAQIDL